MRPTFTKFQIDLKLAKVWIFGKYFFAGCISKDIWGIIIDSMELEQHQFS